MEAVLVSAVAVEMKVAEGVPRWGDFGEATVGGGVAERMVEVEGDCAEMEAAEAVC